MVLHGLSRAWEALGCSLPSLSEWGSGPLLWGLLELASLALSEQPRGRDRGGWVPCSFRSLRAKELCGLFLYPGGWDLLTG